MNKASDITCLVSKPATIFVIAFSPRQNVVKYNCKSKAATRLLPKCPRVNNSLNEWEKEFNGGNSVLVANG